MRRPPQNAAGEEVDDDAHQSQHLDPCRVQVEKASEIAVRIQQLQVRVVVDSGERVGERMDKRRDGEVEDQPLREVAVLLVQGDDKYHCQATRGREGANTSTNSRYCNVRGCVVLVEAASVCRAGTRHCIAVRGSCSVDPPTFNKPRAHLCACDRGNRNMASRRGKQLKDEAKAKQPTGKVEGEPLKINKWDSAAVKNALDDNAKKVK